MKRHNDPYVPVEPGASETSTSLHIKYHHGRRKQKVIRMTVEVLIEYPLAMPNNLCFEYAKDVERRVVNYAKAAARAESREHQPE